VDDGALWMMGELRQRGIHVSAEPGQEDFGWYFDFTTEGEKYCLVISSDGDGGWCLVVERACSLIHP